MYINTYNKNNLYTIKYIIIIISKQPKINE